MKNKLTLVLTVTSLLSSCMVGPDYKRPPVFAPPKFKEAKTHIKPKLISAPPDKNWKPIQPQDYCERSKWWKIFNDPLLNDLEEQLNKFNQNIVNAEANYRQSLAIVDQARSGLFPTLTGSYSLFRQKQGGGATTFITTSGGTSSTGTASTGAIGRSSTSTIHSSILAAIWEPDLWGLVGRTIESDVSSAQSNAALIAYTRLSTQGALAQYYFELRTLDTDQKLLDNTVKAYKKTLQLTRNQYIPYTNEF